MAIGSKKSAAGDNVSFSGKPIWTVSEIIAESSTVKTFRMKPPNKKALFKFIAGQYADITLNIDGEVVNRPYSISSASSARGYLDLSIKREPEGYVSKYMHDHIKAGDKIELSGPFGEFHFDGKGSRNIVLLGAGVGVTPLISMLRSLRAKKWRGNVTAIFGFRDMSDTLYAAELREMAAAWPKLKLVMSFSGKGADENMKKNNDVCSFEDGRINLDCISKYISDLKVPHYYCCGPDQMMEDLRANLISKGVDEEKFNMESFSAPAIDLSKGGEFEISFVKSDVKVISQPGETILLTALRAGVKIPSSCRVGTCMLCQSKLCLGSIEIHNADSLDDDELESGELLTCQTYPRNDCHIEAQLNVHIVMNVYHQSTQKGYFE